jgi:hypothetical protein
MWDAWRFAATKLAREPLEHGPGIKMGFVLAQNIDDVLTKRIAVIHGKC